MYGTAEITLCLPNGDVRRHLRKTNDYDGIYTLLASVAPHEAAEDAASWCENAPLGEGWYDEDFEIEITD